MFTSMVLALLFVFVGLPLIIRIISAVFIGGFVGYLEHLQNQPTTQYKAKDKTPNKQWPTE